MAFHCHDARKLKLSGVMTMIRTIMTMTRTIHSERADGALDQRSKADGYWSFTLLYRDGVFLGKGLIYSLICSPQLYFCCNLVIHTHCSRHMPSDKPATFTYMQTGYRCCTFYCHSNRWTYFLVQAPSNAVGGMVLVTTYPWVYIPSHLSLKPIRCYLNLSWSCPFFVLYESQKEGGQASCLAPPYVLFSFPIILSLYTV